MLTFTRLMIILLITMIFTSIGSMLEFHFGISKLKVASVMIGGFISGYLACKWIGDGMDKK